MIASGTDAKLSNYQSAQSAQFVMMKLAADKEGTCIT